MVYKDFSNMAVHHFGDLPFVWKFKDRYLRMVSYWFRTLIANHILSIRRPLYFYGYTVIQYNFLYHNYTHKQFCDHFGLIRNKATDQIVSPK